MDKILRNKFKKVCISYLSQLPVIWVCALNLDFWLALLQRLGWNMSIRSGDQENCESLITYYTHTYTHSVSWSSNHSIKQLKWQWDLTAGKHTVLYSHD